jgi:hypothetical protein
MKSIIIHLEDSEHQQLSKKKAHRTWKEALINGCNDMDY